MSWLKFWNRKSKGKDDKKSRADLVRSESFHEESQWQTETEKDKNSRLRHTMSISRSGRFKQKRKERSGILDKPELYGEGQGQKNQAQKENIAANGPANNYTNRSPHGTCRDVSHGMRFDANQSGHQATVL